MKFKVVISIIIVIAIIIIFFLIRNGEEESITTRVEFGEYTSTSTITGKVRTAKDTTLSFNVNGVINRIDKNEGDDIKRGDPIIRLNGQDELSLYREQLSQLEQAEEELKNLKDGSGLLDNTVSKNKTASAQTRFDNAIVATILNIKKTQNKIETSIRNNIDRHWFRSANTENIQYIGANIGFTKEQEILEQREEVGKIFTKWGTETLNIKENYKSLLKRISSLELELEEIHKLTSLLQRNSYQATSLLEEAVITAQKELFDEIDSFLRTKSELTSAYDNLILMESEHMKGLLSNQEDIKNQELEVKKQREKLEMLRRNLRDTVIYAPFDGVVGDIFFDVGETVSNNDKVVRVLSKGDKIIVSEVSELNATTINNDERTLSAYIEALNITTDVRLRTFIPAERTEGLSSIYTVEFDILDESVSNLLSSGTSVDIELIRESFTDVLSVSRLAVVQGKDPYVTIIENGKRRKEFITIIGNQGGDLLIEGNVKEGDEVVLHGLPKNARLVEPGNAPPANATKVN